MNKTKEARALWDEFSEVPVGEHDDLIQEDFLHFPAGTDRFDIWHWFEETYDISVENLPEPKWSTDYPTTPGTYWFYGWITPYSKKELPESLSLAKARRIANGSIMCATESQFIYRGQSDGVWKPAELPDPPKRGRR